MADVLLAMRPEWLELILSGRKKAEFRRVMPKRLECDDWVYLYCKGYIHGRVRVQNYDRADMYDDPEDGCRALARYYHRQGGLTREEAYNYLRGGKSPGVIHLAEVQRNKYPVRWEGVGHPQNFIYLKGARW